jgi:hypothetical protein
VLILTGFIAGAAGSRILVPARIDKQFIWLTKLSPVYLASFPEAQGRRYRRDPCDPAPNEPGL